MDAVYSWIKNIIFFLLLSSVLDELLAGSDNKKYIRLFTGFILILLVISPVVKWLSAGANFDYYLDANEFALDAYDYSTEITGADQKREDAVMEEYKQALINQAGSLLNQKGYTVVRADLKINTDMESGEYGRLLEMDIVAERIGRTDGTQSSKDEKGTEKIVIDKIVIGQEKEQTETAAPEELALRDYLSDYYVLSEEKITVRIKEAGYGEKEAVD